MERLDIIKTMRSQGSTLDEIGKHFKLTRQRIWQILRGWKLRNKEENKEKKNN